MYSGKSIISLYFTFGKLFLVKRPCSNNNFDSLFGHGIYQNRNSNI